MLEHILNAGTAGADSWYPPQLAYDRRQGGDRLLFPGRPPGPAWVDLSLTMLPRIQPILNSRTQPIFFRLYGLNGTDGGGSEQWQRLLSMGQALHAWTAREEDAEAGAGALFEQVAALFGMRREDTPSVVAQIAPGVGTTAAAARGWMGSEAHGGQKPILLLAVDDGAALAAYQREAVDWVSRRLERSGMGGREENEGQPAGGAAAPRRLSRDIVLTIAHRGAAVLRNQIGGAGNTPSFVVLDPQQLGRGSLLVRGRRRLAQSPGGLPHGAHKLRLDAAEVDVVVVAQAVASPGQLQQLGHGAALLPGEAFEEARLQRRIPCGGCSVAGQPGQ